MTLNLKIITVKTHTLLFAVQGDLIQSTKAATVIP